MFPRENAQVECGSTLKIRFKNRGAPIHITATTSNAGMFTDFFHENMYVIDEIMLGIPLQERMRHRGFLMLTLSPVTAR